MIEVLQKIANRIYPIRLSFVFVAVLCLFLLIYILLSGDARLDLYMLPVVALFSWAICLYGISDAFRRVPEKAAVDDRFFVRVKKRWKRLIAWIWSVGFLICTALLIFLSSRVLTMAITAS